MLSTRRLSVCALVLWTACGVYASEIVARIASNGELRLMIGTPTGEQLRPIDPTSVTGIDAREYRFDPSDSDHIFIFAATSDSAPPAVLAEFVTKGASLLSGDGVWTSASFTPPLTRLSDPSGLSIGIREINLRYAWKPTATTPTPISTAGINPDAQWMTAPHGGGNVCVFRIAAKDLYPLFQLGETDGGRGPRDAFFPNARSGAPRIGGGGGGGAGGGFDDTGPPSLSFAAPAPEFPALGEPFNPNVPSMGDLPARPAPFPPTIDDAPGRGASGPFGTPGSPSGSPPADGNPGITPGDEPPGRELPPIDVPPIDVPPADGDKPDDEPPGIPEPSTALMLVTIGALIRSRRSRRMN